MSIRILSGIACAAGLTALASGGVLVQSTDDLWDYNQGNLVTAHTPMLSQNHPSRMFGTVNQSAAYEKTNAVFADRRPASTVHWAEWQTPGLITLRSFVLFAGHDGAPRDANYRGFSRFSLFAWDDGENVWDELFAIEPALFYGDTVAPPGVIIESPASHYLYIGVNVGEVTADKFRAEFVQYGPPSSASGPRIFELDGYDTVIPAPGVGMIAGLGLLLSTRRRR